MRITLKLYAMLSEYLPSAAKRNVTTMDLVEGASVDSVIRQLGLPRELVHLVLVNGVYIAPEQLKETYLKEADALAIWPPVAGG